MKLEEIRVDKFKRIDQIQLPLSDLNILVGTNGSGKSSILQAVHLASCLMRQADRIRSETTTTVSVADLDYLPSDQYWRLGHGADWGNKAASPFSTVTFKFSAPLVLPGQMPAPAPTARIEMRAARNAGVSVKGELPEQVRNQFRGDRTFFSGFIPGISGIPNVEQKNAERVVLKACSFGDSNVYLRNALDLLTPEEATQLQSWLEPLLGEISLRIRFDPAKDLNINAEAITGGITMPLELLGTGYLQLIQILCYILLFKPKILLIDEPDIHLHPTIQEKLAKVLLEIAHSQDLKILMSTHSPFIVRGAPVGTNVVWLSEGQKVSSDRTMVEKALGWGAFGKKIIVVSEDAITDHLKKLINQWPELERVVAVLPGRGYRHLPTKEEVQELRATLGNNFKILVHRDRDSLSDDETETLQDSFAADGIKLWLTEQSDLEAEFCDAAFLVSLTGESIETCTNWLDEILVQGEADINAQFSKQRAAHNAELHQAGGGPTNADVWATFQGRPLKGAKGKYVFKKLKNKVPNNRFTEAAVSSHEGYPERAATLRAALLELLN